MCKGLTVCVSGGRDYDDEARLHSVMDEIHLVSGIALVVHGDCPTGADSYAKQWAKSRGVAEKPIKADWDKYCCRDTRNPAGILRNQKLLDHGFDLLLAFPTGGPGTKDMINRTHRQKIPYRVFANEGLESFFL